MRGDDGGCRFKASHLNDIGSQSLMKFMEMVVDIQVAGIILNNFCGLGWEIG